MIPAAGAVAGGRGTCQAPAGSRGGSMTDKQGGYTGLNRFDRVDATGEADAFLEFLDRVEALPETQARRRRSFDRMALRPGMAVAEIGCGSGTAARALA